MSHLKHTLRVIVKLTHMTIRLLHRVPHFHVFGIMDWLLHPFHLLQHMHLSWCASVSLWNWLCVHVCIPLMCAWLTVSVWLLIMWTPFPLLSASQISAQLQGFLSNAASLLTIQGRGWVVDVCGCVCVISCNWEFVHPPNSLALLN